MMTQLGFALFLFQNVGLASMTIKRRDSYLKATCRDSLLLNAGSVSNVHVVCVAKISA